MIASILLAVAPSAIFLAFFLWGTRRIHNGD